MPGVLLVEDDVDVAEALTELLRERDFFADIVTSGRAALEYLERQAPSVVILDWSLDGVPSGAALIREIRLRVPKTPIFVSSGSLEAARLAVDAGADRYLAKPFATEELFTLLDQYLLG